MGCKASLATALKGGFVVGMRSLPATPVTATLGEALEQVAILTGHPPNRAVSTTAIAATASRPPAC
jgi:IS5 family transposase